VANRKLLPNKNGKWKNPCPARVANRKLPTHQEWKTENLLPIKNQTLVVGPAASPFTDHAILSSGKKMLLN
jgi:hypothetical protein